MRMLLSRSTMPQCNMMCWNDSFQFQNSCPSFCCINPPHLGQVFAPAAISAPQTLHEIIFFAKTTPPCRSLCLHCNPCNYSLSSSKWLQCKQGWCTMKEKKTAVITVRIPPKTKETIDREAEKREWTSSKMAEKILTAWAENQSVDLSSSIS